MAATFQRLNSGASVPNVETVYAVEPFGRNLDLAKLADATKAVVQSLPKALVWQDLIIKRKRKSWIPFRLQWPYDDALLNQQVSHAGRCAIRADVLHHLHQTQKISALTDTSAALRQICLADASAVVEVPEILRFVGRERNACYLPRMQLSPERCATSISVIINYRDRPDLMATCLTSLAKQRVSAKLEVLLVDNQSHADNRERVETLASQLFPNEVQVIHLSYDAPFNHSAQTNLAVEKSTGEVLVMLNNDADLIGSNTLQTLANWALMPDIASVGPQVVGKNDRLVSSGIEIYPADAVRPGGIRESTVRPLAQTIRYAAGNSFACAALAREHWVSVGGLDADTFPTQYNDANYDVKALTLGLRHLYIGHLKVYHQPGQSEPRTREEGEKLHGKIRAMYPQLQQYASISPVLVKLKGPLLERVINPRAVLHGFVQYRKLEKLLRKTFPKLMQ